MYKEKGITLIALIITIIIMLILVIVTVQIATTGGLIDKAHEAADKTKAEAANETNKMSTVASEIDDILNPPNPETDFLPVAADFNGVIEGYVGTSTSVVIPRTINGIPVTEIGDLAFYHNTSIENISIPSSVVTYPVGCFIGCTSLKTATISSNITTLSYSVFQDCTSLTSVTIPATITKISGSAFNNCTALTTVNIPNSVTMIEYGAFTNTPFLNNLLSANDGVAIIGENNQILLKVDSVKTGNSYSVPTGISVIAEDALAGCNFISITLPSSLIRIGRSAFNGCDNLTSIIIPSGVTTIDTQAFFHCYALANVTIPSSVTTIGSDAFHECSASLIVEIAKAEGSITGSPWGARTGSTINWNP